MKIEFGFKFESWGTATLADGVLRLEGPKTALIDTTIEAERKRLSTMNRRAPSDEEILGELLRAPQSYAWVSRVS